MFSGKWFTQTHTMLSYDRLHYDAGGLWGDHLFPQALQHIDGLGRAANAKVEKQYVDGLWYFHQK